MFKIDNQECIFSKSPFTYYRNMAMKYILFEAIVVRGIIFWLTNLKFKPMKNDQKTHAVCKNEILNSQ